MLQELDSTAERRGTEAACLVGAAATLMLAINDRQGMITGFALVMLAACVLLLVGSFVLPPIQRARGLAPWLLIAAMIGNLALLPAAMLRLKISVPDERALMIFLEVAALAAGLAGLLALSRRWLSVALFSLLVLLAGWIGFWTITAMAEPGIDVYIFQELSSRAFFAGDNPYSILMPDGYSPADSARFYGPGVSKDGMLQFGFPYTPLPLWMALPGYLVGDVRYSHLAAILLTSVLIAYGWRGNMGKLAAVLYVFSPQFMHVLGMSWTEPLSILLLVSVALAAKKKHWSAPYLFGLLLVSKQYMVLLTPLVLLLVERPWSAKRVGLFFAKAVLAGSIVTLPLALWDLEGFMRSAVWLQFKQPFRRDALSYLAWMKPANPAAWLWLPLVTAAVGLSGGEP